MGGSRRSGGNAWERRGLIVVGSCDDGGEETRLESVGEGRRIKLEVVHV